MPNAILTSLIPPHAFSIGPCDRSQVVSGHHNSVAMNSPSADDPNVDARANPGRCSDVYRNYSDRRSARSRDPRRRSSHADRRRHVRRDRADIQRVWCDFFRCQQITPPQQVAFTRCFGEIEFNIFGERWSVSGSPEIVVVSNVTEDGRPIGVRRAGENWHSDMCYTARPPRGAPWWRCCR
jgi:hypothetical protein